MASGIDFPTFYDRFEHLRRKLRRHLGWQTLTVLAICSLLGFVGIACLDYRLELSWNWRAVSLGLTGGAALVLAGWLLITGLQRWNRYRTASAIERRFPELGQRVRTAVEFRGRSVSDLKSAGVAPGLVRALETEAAVTTLPLPLENLIPVRRLMALSIVITMIAGAVVSACLWNREWKTALRRTLLADEPFSRMVYATQNEIVNKGGELTLKVAVQGRTREAVILRTRPLDREGMAWDEQKFAFNEGDTSVPDESTFESSIPNITSPFAYQWVAGPERSPEFLVDVRYPLEIETVSVAITPPEYTGLPTSIQTDGNLNVLEATEAHFVFTLDGVPSSAQIILNPTSKSRDEGLEAETIAARIQGQQVIFDKRLTHDVNWSLEAVSAQGVPLARNSYRIRVRKDQPPMVYFEEPAEALDVHPLAEILMRIRARDDFGLVRAGIVFQINNDEEHTLFAEDYQQAADEPAEKGRLTPTTAAALERVLPLEHFKLIQKDAITYYAFAEDNHPGEPQRTETELRFIDIRPFKITYRLPPENDGMGDPAGQGPRRATFEELIGRQRTALNRTLAMKRAKSADLSGLDRLMKFEKEIADLTNGLAAFLQATGMRFQVQELLENADLLFQAERAMLDSIDSMSVGKFDVAMLQEKDAVRFLIESRDRLIVTLQKSNSTGLQDAINDFFRQQQTKLRRKPQETKDEQEKAKNLLEELARLTSQQALVAAELDASGENSDSSPSPSAESGTTGAGTEKSKDMTTTADGGANAAESTMEQPPRGRSGRMSHEELAKLQQEIAIDAGAVRKELEQMRQTTELTKKRMAAATEAAEATSESLVRGNSKEAAKSANVAVEKFQQVLELAQGILADELADQLAIARDLAEDVSREEERLADRAIGNASSPQGTSTALTEEQREGAAKQAERLAASGESLADILNNATKSTLAADQKMIPKVAELLDKGGLAGAVDRMQQQPDGLRGGRLEEEQQAAAEIADKLEAAARKLDNLQREIVNPKIAELMELEGKAKGLEEELEDVETRRQQERWQMAAGEFLEEVEGSAGVTDSDEELKKELKGAGWDEETNTVRGGSARTFDAERYRRSLRHIAEDLREQVQRLLLAEITVTGDETPPAQYDGLVSKYQRVLTSGLKSPDARPRSKNRSSK